ncbi:phosphatase PAP2 family protein [Rhodoferax sp. U11-2br]|uniref:phosphatase PAP2 family protein n=1 Tax=Rhodoferax sp. U11-2br TaxID=2838878 RepID=UPI001BEC39C9|nr:phosphatase PAP2 family protein [Rhodoferax sp. U11-2br]MBT3067501.1 phosphatase PAP2 family protein [Rhodoferax sp. U11-2br]
MWTDAEWLAQVAFWAGQHALPISLVLQALLLTTTWAGWWLLRPGTLLREPRVQGILHTALGITTALMGAGVFTVLARALLMGPELGLVDQVFADALRTHVPPLALPVFALLTHFADTAVLTGLGIGVAMALLARRRPGLAVGWVAAVGGNSLLNHSLKQVFARTRPLDADGLALAPGFSFPSGHSSGAVVAYGMLAYLALRLLPPRWHLPALLTAVGIAFSVCVSRLFLRVHFASDVIAGWMSGSTWLALCILGVELLRRSAKG